MWSRSGRSVFLVIGVLLAGIPPSAQGRAPFPPVLDKWIEVLDPLPSFEVPDLAGTMWTVETLRGKTTILAFWATFCVACTIDLPHVQELHERYRNDPAVQVVSINVDPDHEVVKKFMREHRYTFPVLLASNIFTWLEQGTVLPAHWVVDSEARIRAKCSGLLFGGCKVDQALQRLGKNGATRDREAVKSRPKQSPKAGRP